MNSAGCGWFRVVLVEERLGVSVKIFMMLKHDTMGRQCHILRSRPCSR